MDFKGFLWISVSFLQDPPPPCFGICFETEVWAPGGGVRGEGSSGKGVGKVAWIPPWAR